MLKISRQTVQKLGSISSDVVELFAKLEEARTGFEAAAESILDEIRELQSEARGIMEDEANSAAEYYDEKSEKWQEGDRGQAYCEWKDRLQSLADDLDGDMEALEVTMPEQPEWVTELDECEFAEFES
jgi:hypothetical protein